MFSTLKLTVEDGVARVVLNRPEKMNALNDLAWKEMRTVFDLIDSTPGARVVVLEGAGENFCSGMDVANLVRLSADFGAAEHCPGRTRENLLQWIREIQNAVSAIERCRKPVIAAIHGYCLGGALDVITACDMRYCTDSAIFSVLEIDMAVVPDIGTIQRLPQLVGHGIARELIYTGRKFNGTEARDMKLVNQCFMTQKEMQEQIARIAAMLVAKSPLTLRGCKEILLHEHHHSIVSGLQYVATWNAAMLVSADFTEAIAAFQQKRNPLFQD